ncbi:Histidine kinase-, DNA gyrase B-, and HSP90-like ATPase [Chitinophaga sp. CF118]|uniref:ATP-binding protein n=1 Tax=Chitinophaga sp. CF118 TaxID=1884367 RepID=UPI0008EEF5C6|nr:ATP-binding protein [Chitinophaga sp. CF118]SFE79964.1 Histidine kinase-, DNA gyrase B-, and HSP90-like ATPase [Chitinophaga sp. CF118]
MREKVSVTDTGIQSSGLPRDYMEAVAEYIWNGFDAGASVINIDFDTNEIGTINSLSISDNGSGIDFNQLKETFGNFNDSIKKASFQKSSSVIKGNKGRGRFSFSAFSGKAVWKTVYQDNEGLSAYEIIITRNTKDYFDPHNRRTVTNEPTGTTVTFYDLFEVSGFSFQSEEFKSFLIREYGWFLMLNREKEFQIRINGVPVSYQQLIAESDIDTLPIRDAEGKDNYFKITFVRWSEKIGDKFFFYFLNSAQQEVFKDLTSFNNNAIGFYHSVYVESRYFDAFNPADTEQSQNLFEKTRHHSTFKALMGHLHSLLRIRQKAFVDGEAAEKLVDVYDRNGIFPKFDDEQRKRELLRVVKGMYCIEPRLFQGLNREQQRINVGLISLLLDAGKRTEIMKLMEQVVHLTDEDREQLQDVLHLK